MVANGLQDMDEVKPFLNSVLVTTFVRFHKAYIIVCCEINTTLQFIIYLFFTEVRH